MKFMNNTLQKIVMLLLFSLTLTKTMNGALMLHPKYSISDDDLSSETQGVTPGHDLSQPSSAPISRPLSPTRMLYETQNIDQARQPSNTKRFIRGASFWKATQEPILSMLQESDPRLSGAVRAEYPSNLVTISSNNNKELKEFILKHVIANEVIANHIITALKLVPSNLLGIEDDALYQAHETTDPHYATTQKVRNIKAGFALLAVATLYLEFKNHKDKKPIIFEIPYIYLLPSIVPNLLKNIVATTDLLPKDNHIRAFGDLVYDKVLPEIKGISPDTLQCCDYIAKKIITATHGTEETPDKRNGIRYTKMVKAGLATARLAFKVYQIKIEIDKIRNRTKVKTQALPLEIDQPNDLTIEMDPTETLKIKTESLKKLYTIAIVSHTQGVLLHTIECIKSYQEFLDCAPELNNFIQNAIAKQLKKISPIVLFFGEKIGRAKNPQKLLQELMPS